MVVVEKRADLKRILKSSLAYLAISTSAVELCLAASADCLDGLVRMNLEASWLFLLLCLSALALGISRARKRKVLVLVRREVV